MKIILINTYDDLTNLPSACPMYHRSIILLECRQAYGVICYKHDLKKDKLHVFIDSENSSPLMFLQESDFDLNNTHMSILDLNYCEDDRERCNDNNNDRTRRRLNRSRKLKKTISLPIKNIHKSDVDIYYEGKKNVVPYFNIMIRFFKNKCKFDFITQKLYDIRDTLTVAGVEESDSHGCSVRVELFSKTFTKKIRTAVKPLVYIRSICRRKR